ncbi:hypothetical protein KXR53_34785 [Inquilinus limosus]|uniref:carbamoyltransferase family protein n=1 Tax=Inquilinus limosus TaxID=171674 RepID=UPI003F13AFFD
MNIIGVSGLDTAVPFKRSEFPALSERQFRLIQGADAAAALIIDGEIVAAAAEERFNGKKHCSDFPSRAIAFCLEAGRIGPENIDEIAHCFDYSHHRATYAHDDYGARYFDSVYDRKNLVAAVARALPDFPQARIRNVDHHLSHAAGGYWTSGWDECLVVVIDGMGEVDGATVYAAKQGLLEKLGSLPGDHSLGIFYSVVTFHLGFDFNADEYKIMGLAPYGDPSRYRAFFDTEVVLTDDGFCRIPCLGLNRDPIDRDNYLRTLAYLSEKLGPGRDPDGAIEQDHMDVAAALQETCNRALLHICDHYRRLTGLKRLVLTGGVAQNCTANGQILKAGLFDEIYVPPAAGDDGAALGAALYRASLAREVENRRRGVPFYGPGYSAERLSSALGEFADRIEVVGLESLRATCERAAADIADGQVVAWYRGRMEFGARALGNRSIIADATDPAMRDRVNSMVKKREAFRPFAPAVSHAHAQHWFDIAGGADLSYMTVIVDVREEHRTRLPAVTHVDGTARVQTVSAAENPDFHELIMAVGRRTGVHMVLNTSFNVRGQPIVDTPEDAIATFLRTGIDALYLGNNRISRKA